ncbi:MAG: LysR family transcriptional regulator [Gemmobacter sp.]|nr:LysR family transcriptional regulator [Gemmobacter sp.]
MLSITLRQLEYALAVARHGGVTAAADALHVSQPALSVALAQLEQHLGRSVFLRRRGGGMVPTSYGRGFLDQAETHITGLARLLSDQAGPAAPVRLICFEDLAPVLLAPLLVRLATDCPEIPVTPEVAGFEPLAESIRRGRADLAISWDLGLDAGFVRHELTRVAPHAVLALGHPLTAQATVSLAQLAGQSLILADQGPSLGHIRALFGQQGLQPVIAHRTATLDLMRSFAANGLGVGLSYTRPAPNQSPDGRPLTTRPIADAGPGAPIVLVTAADNPLSDSAARIAAAIRHHPPRMPDPEPRP